MYRQTIVCIALCATLITGCAGIRPSHQEISAADYGDRPNDEQAHAMIRQFMAGRLIDLYSANYDCTPTVKAWITGSGFHNVNYGGRVTYGYIAICNINAKNRLGGYTGAKQHRFLIRLRADQGQVDMITGPVEIGVVNN